MIPWEDNRVQILRSTSFKLNRKRFTTVNVVLYRPLKCHNIWIENTFIHLNTETIEVKEKKEAAKKKRREREKRKRDEKKANTPANQVSRSARSKSAQDNGSDSDNSSISSNTGKRQKQETVVQKVTMYIHIQSLAPQPPGPRHASTSRSRGKTEAVPVAIRGPCFFQLDQTYDDFKGIIAKELPCKLKLLPTVHVTWKYEKPANDPKKPLSSNAGYQAMVMSLTERKANHVIVVSMPPPKVDDAVSL